MTEIFNADSARALMKDVENNPFYIDAITKIKCAAQEAFNEITIYLVKPEVENKLKSLGFEVINYIAKSGNGYTKIKW
mgnify:CR=1 FL=1